MLSSEHLRVRIRNGRIYPLFCSVNAQNNPEQDLASKIITYCADAQKNRNSKGKMIEAIRCLESDYDYKLVRGMFSLLERRSSFEQSFPAKSIATPELTRKRLFEESARQGLALSKTHRQEIIQKVSKQMHVTAEDIKEMMWGDMGENLVIMQFDMISPKDLIYWYNISLFQTLLFRCVRMKFNVEGGTHWKQVLRNVKRHGLMYSLEHHNDSAGKERISCALEGPTSLFKMTDRYGTSIAKLIPSITGTPAWNVSGTVLRKTSNGQKTYAFELSSESTREFLRPVLEISGNEEGNQTDGSNAYDSLVEARFAKIFHQHFDQNDSLGWKISREPDPLIADGKAMIPDFLFERFGKKVYFEIVGFWTKEYLERKTAKLNVLFSQNKDISLLVAVNSELSCSEIESIPREMVFTFKKDVPIKPILEYLKKIDKEITREKASSIHIKIDRKSQKVISIKEIVKEHDIPESAALKVVNSTYPGAFITANTHLVSSERAKEVDMLLRETKGFVEACKRMESLGIPETCHAELLSQLGYNVVWSDLDPNNATVSRE